jgi:membrane-associated phospholipid phosphatase
MVNHRPPHSYTSYWIPLIAMFLSVLVFVIIAWQVFEIKNLQLDREIALLTVPSDNSFGSLMKNISFFGSTGFLLPAYVFITCAYLFSAKPVEAILVAITGIGEYSVVTVLKTLFGRTRPLDSLIDPPVTFSFPSGHSASSMTFFLLVGFILSQKMRNGARFMVLLLFILLALLIGYTRIYLKVHYPTDVLSGFCVAFFWLGMMKLLFDRLKLARALK